MRAELLLGMALFLAVAATVPAKEPQVTIEDTGSTNRMGLRVTFDHDGEATVEPRHGEPQHVKLDRSRCEQFVRDAKAMAPMSELPVNHCAKSASFGSSLYVEFNGERSPDLSCPTPDTRMEELQKHANEILQAAREAAGIPSRRLLAMPPVAPK